MTSMIFSPLIADWVFKDEQGIVIAAARFDSIEALQPPEFKHDISHLSVEPLTGNAVALEISVEAWRESVKSVESFVERAFGAVKSKWPRTIDPGFEVKFDEDGLGVTVEIGTASDNFDRRTVFFKDPQTGEHMLRLESWTASVPMRVHSWVVYHNAVNSLIELNNGGNIDLGL